MKIVAVDVYAISLPLFMSFKVAFGTLPFDHIVVRMETDDGQHGWGDSGHLLGPYTGEVIEGAFVNARRLASLMLGADPREIGPLHARMDQMLYGNHQVKCAFDLALYDLTAKSAGMSLSSLLGGALVDKVQAQLDISMGTVDEVLANVRRALDFGISSVGLKIGRPASPSVEHDVAIVKAVRSEFGPELEITLDGNGGYSRFEAVEALRQLAPMHIAHAEQLVPGWDIEGLAWVASKVDVPIVVDEGIWDASSILRAARIDAAAIMHLKLPKTGGVYGAHKAAIVCEAAGVPLTLGSLTMSEVGQAALVHFTASHSACLNHRQKLRGGGLFFPEDFAATMLRFEGGYFYVPTEPGIGLDVDEDKLARFTTESWHAEDGA